MHVSEGDEHYFALCLMLAAVDFLGIKSVLDIGAGTGRTIAQIKRVRPDLVVKGIEPVKELREIGYSKGISTEELIAGDALALPFREGDGLSYSYSVFNDHAQIRAQCQRIHLLNTMDAGANLYRTASHVALLGIKK
jgi:SAM-dependent methyltransferase